MIVIVIAIGGHRQEKETISTAIVMKEVDHALAAEKDIHRIKGRMEIKCEMIDRIHHINKTKITTEAEAITVIRTLMTVTRIVITNRGTNTITTTPTTATTATTTIESTTTEGKIETQKTYASPKIEIISI